MKKYQVKINNMELEIIQDDDGKFITPYLCIEDWGKFGTALKPSFEPIIVARKPFKGSLVDNVIEYGVGGINIDECRVPFEDTPNPATNPKYRKNAGYKTPARGQESNGAVAFTSSKNETNDLGRFPANTILTYDETDFEEVCGGFPNTSGKGGNKIKSVDFRNYGESFGIDKEYHHFNDSGSASRYFYCAKASKKDRDEGCIELEDGLLRRMRPELNKIDKAIEYLKNEYDEENYSFVPKKKLLEILGDKDGTSNNQSS